jgi:hypothetical protein
MYIEPWRRNLVNLRLQRTRVVRSNLAGVYLPKGVSFFTQKK